MCTSRLALRHWLQIKRRLFDSNLDIRKVLDIALNGSLVQFISYAKVVVMPLRNLA